MNKKKIAVLILLFVAVIGFSSGHVIAAKGYTNYKGTIKMKLDKTSSNYSPYYGPTYERDGFRKEWMHGKKGKYTASSEIYKTKKGKKVTKKSTLTINEYPTSSNLKIIVKFRYWNGYKNTNKYKTKRYYKSSKVANKYIGSTNWIPYSIKIYTKNTSKNFNPSSSGSSGAGSDGRYQ